MQITINGLKGIEKHSTIETIEEEIERLLVQHEKRKK